MRVNSDHIQHVLVVGSWAKEEITIENIKQNSVRKAYAFMDTHNPAIMEKADGYKVGNFYKIDQIVDNAKRVSADLVLLTTASPLAMGVVNALEKENILAFGPSKIAAQLESNKAFTRKLLKKYIPYAAPIFRVFEDVERAVRYAKSMDWQVAVKPLGLTDGLGVRVYGDQMESPADVKDYIKYILDNKYSGHSAVIVEEKLVGEEFTLQCLVDGENMIPTPAVQDFKKLLPDERGPNTASMGSYSAGGNLLPFMDNRDYDMALKCIQGTLKAFNQETAGVCRGFLYGQFMITHRGVKLIEYNFRPGDPEWLNTMSLLKGDLINSIIQLLNGDFQPLEFSSAASVLKYIVPPEYPEKLNQVLKVDFDLQEVQKTGARVYHSCGKNEQDQLSVGSERGLAFIATGEDVTTANQKVDKAISLVDGDFYYRYDIATQELIEKKNKHVHSLKQARPEFQTAREEDFLMIQRFVARCPPLEGYPPHVFKILLRYFRNTCFVAKIDREVLGWVLGFISQVHDATYFLWQIGIGPALQGKGVGGELLAYVEDEVEKKGCKRIEVTIDPENIPSQKLFEKKGYQNISEQKGKTVKVEDNLALKNYYGPARHFMLYEKILG